MIPLARKIVLKLSKEKSLDEKKLKIIRNSITKDNGGVLPKNLELIEAYRELMEEGKIANSPHVLKLIQKRKVRTMSGIANITVLTKDLGCPGQCIYCPTEKGMPKSYLSNEPAMMRAVMNNFNSYKQVKTRLNGLIAQGHDITKIDIRTAGGTWGAVPEWYRQEFLKGIYLALNEGPGELRIENYELIIKDSILEDLIKENETANCRCVGLWVETRPDWVNEEELKKLRSYGVTGIELGIQTTDDAVNAFCKRGHGLKESVEATKMCRDIGLKVCHHLMPNLPTATMESDLKSGKDLFENEGLRPDYLKIYPTMVTPYSALSEMVKKDPSVHTAYTDEELMKLIAEIKQTVPEYCRIIRVIRDFPAESIEEGSKKSNLRQIMQRMGVQCRCVRCREIQDSKIKSYELRVKSYKANDGEEFFISIDETNLAKIIGLCRLRFPSADAKLIFDELQGAAIIRELHVYGRQESLDSDKPMTSNTQHLGFGKKLMEKAEELAKKAGYKKIAVIAAIGTREYYRKLGYRLEGTYMVKWL
jgi:elongator complex protein 3